MNRNRFLAVIALAVGLIAAAGVYIRRPALLDIEAGTIRAVDVEVSSLTPEGGGSPQGGTTDPEAIAALVAVLRGGEERQDHKCGASWAITLKRSFGTPVKVEFLPGHDEAWYEFRYERKAYRVPRAAFIAATQRTGVQVPLKCW